MLAAFTPIIWVNKCNKIVFLLVTTIMIYEFVINSVLYSIKGEHVPNSDDYSKFQSHKMV